jgi:small GTP-binding protein
MDALRQFAAKMGQTSGEPAVSKKSKKKKKGGNAKHQNADGGVSKVAGTEAGGITQVISAFQVSLPAQSASDDEELEVLAMLEEEERQNIGQSESSPKLVDQSKSSVTVTFLDTPGHAAFSKMRHCGMYATDVLVLVIAADDGLKEQTKEIIELYQTQSNKNLKLVVAMTKIDKVGSENVTESRTRIENELLSHGIETVSVGGSIPIVPVSGITSEGVEELVRVLGQRGQGLMWDTSTEEGMGVVLDARVERGLGVVVDCVVRTGQFVKGGHVVVERQDAKIRLLKDGKFIWFAHFCPSLRFSLVFS